MNFDNLFAPIKINRLELPNRMVMAPMATNFADSQGGITAQMLSYYRERARSRPGMIISESCYVSPEGRGAVKRLGLARDDVIPGHRVFTEMLHRENVSVCAQLHHAGCTAPMKVIGQYPVSCSSVPLLSKGDPFVGVIPRTLSRSQIQDLVRCFGAAALRAIEAGYDCVQVHAAHGYLINQFLSPLTNIRDDEYGGSDAKRMRFLLEVVREVRRKVPADYPVICRVSGAEFQPGGYGLEFIAQLAQRLEKEGVDEISVSAGSYTRLDLIAPLHPEPQACYRRLAATIKSGLSIPVGLVGRMKTPEMAEAVLKAGDADLIYLGRELLADPQWPAKARRPDLGPIRPCVFCNQGCFDRMLAGAEIRCAVNPRVGREGVSYDPQLSKGRRLLVVGGGPAGMQAAVMGAECGFDVHLVEKTDRLGGKLEVGAVPAGKQGLAGLREYLRRRLIALGVRVQTGTTVTPAFARENAFDKIVVATGSVACDAETFGLPSDRTVAAERVLSGHPLPGQNVVVVGGGLVGVETALHLQGAGKQVALVEIAADVLINLGAVLKRNLLTQLNAQSVPVYVDSKIIAIGDAHVTISNVVGEFQLPADHVVLAVGYRSDVHAGWKDLGAAIPVVTIGDAYRVGMLLDISLQLQQFLLDASFLEDNGPISQDSETTCTLV